MVEGLAKTDLAWFSHTTGVVAAISAVAFSLAIVHEIGFFSQIDPKLLPLLSLENIVQNSLFNLPVAIFSILGGAMGPMSRAVLGWKKPDPATRRPRSALSRFFLERPYTRIEAIFTCVFGLLVFLFLDQWPVVLSILALFALLPIWTLAKRAETRARYRFASEAVAILFLLVAWTLSGAAEARQLTGTPDYGVRVGRSFAQVELVRTSSDFIIVRYETGEVGALRKAEVSELRRIAPPHRGALLPIDFSRLWPW